MDFNIDNESFARAYKCLRDANELLDFGLGNLNELNESALSLINKNDIGNNDRLDFMFTECFNLKEKMYNTIKLLSEWGNDPEGYFNDIINSENIYELDNFGDFSTEWSGKSGNIYKQNMQDYPGHYLYGDIPYGAGNLATNGCGFFSVLSNITSKTGYEFSYDEIKNIAEAVMAENKGKENQELSQCTAEYLSEAFNFKVHRGSKDSLNENLQKGMGAIGYDAMHGSVGRHIIAISGIDENGNYIINDSQFDVEDVYTANDFTAISTPGKEEYIYLDFGSNNVDNNYSTDSTTTMKM